MEARNSKGHRSRDGRLMRAKRIPDGDVELVNVVSAMDPLTGTTFTAGDFTCKSQSGSEPYHGHFEFDGAIHEEVCRCSCKDFLNGFMDKHLIKALLLARCPEEYLA